MAAAAGRLAALSLPLLLTAGLAPPLVGGVARSQGRDPTHQLIKGGGTPTAVPNNPAEFLPSRRCPLIVPGNDWSAQPMRIAPADVAAKNRLGCVSPNDAIYGNNGCPVRRCGANQGVVPLPQPSR